MGIDLQSLERHPDITAPDLQAFDATDVLLIDSARDLTGDFTNVDGHDIVVIGDRHGALTLSLTLPTAQGGLALTGVRVFQDPLLGERALVRNADRFTTGGHAPDFSHHELGRTLIDGAKFVLMQLPKSLDELRELAYWIQAYADPSVTVLAGGRVKHMSLAQNDILGRYFATVQAGLAHRKSRVITASGAMNDPADPPFPVTGTDPDLPFRLHAFGSTFGGATLDHGTRLLVKHLADIAPDARTIVDLGCGNGSLAVSAALARPEAEVIATDQSWGAVRAARETVRWAGVADRVRVDRADGCERVPDGWADLILLNPPFHAGHIVTEAVAHRLIRESARALAPGGTLAVVYNSHLSHRRIIENTFDEVTQIARDRTFTLIAAR